MDPPVGAEQGSAFSKQAAHHKDVGASPPRCSSTAGGEARGTSR
ncbi:MAG: hypothetical protein AVDCRST_MAG75-3128 [uncultured Propionibacteriaceae bacterium]|uniref:Uncharacterized protein n=1 Tax=uncultured Propionibacteriaceae bacterium TaxID=257457 RepID=A0A6J4PLU4_9ACTN|nr:MAG: hypothetical protein AVDCRST_MAG75-3128 [uncultured Propionibacteriaceae bacterium]